MRVSPKGITSLQDRLEEAKKRYLQKQKGVYKKEQFEKFIPMWMDIEKQIFTHCKKPPLMREYHNTWIVQYLIEVMVF